MHLAKPQILYSRFSENIKILDLIGKSDISQLS